MANYAKTVVDVAEQEVGYLEKKSNDNLDNKVANAGEANYTRYGKWIGMNGQYWCASFVSWCFNKAYGTEGKKLLGGSYSAACEVIRQNFIKKDQYSTKNPKKGDVIFFVGSRHSGANHIGIVYKVGDSKVYTIEGNTSGGSTVVDNGGGVAKKSYAISYNKILGYGKPKYDEEKKETDAVTYYKKYAGKSNSIVEAMTSIGAKDTSIKHRAKIAVANDIVEKEETYKGTAEQNSKMLNKLKKGKLIKA